MQIEVKRDYLSDESLALNSLKHLKKKKKINHHEKFAILGYLLQVLKKLLTKCCFVVEENYFINTR